jgi:hypothetical protein
MELFHILFSLLNQKKQGEISSAYLQSQQVSRQGRTPAFYFYAPKKA